MKKPKSAKIAETIEARELELYLLNTEEFWPGIEARAAVVKKHYLHGEYDREKAIMYFYPVAHAAAKKYIKEFCNNENCNYIFSVSDKYTAAAGIVAYLEDDYFNY